MEKILPSGVIHKTTIFIALAIAALGAVGVLTTMITIAPTADAVECMFHTHGRVCPPPVEDSLCGSICNTVCSAGGCIHIGPDR